MARESALKKAVWGAGVLLASLPALAQTYVEGGLHLVRMKVTVDGETVRVDPKMLGVTLGYDLTPYLSAEAMLATGISSGTGILNGAPGSIRIDQAVGLLVKPRWRVNERVEVYAKLGWSSIRLSFEGQDGGSYQAKDNTYGVGASYQITERAYASVTYMALHKENRFNVSSVRLGVGYRF